MNLDPVRTRSASNHCPRGSPLLDEGMPLDQIWKDPRGRVTKMPEVQEWTAADGYLGGSPLLHFGHLRDTAAEFLPDLIESHAFILQRRTAGSMVRR